MTSELTLIQGGDGEPEAPVNVHTALSRLIGEMPSIGRGEHSDEFGGYQYRGIEQITREVQPLLAKHGLVVIPSARLLSHTPAVGMRDNWTDVVIEVSWKIVGPDGTFLEAQTLGIGRDGGDKGANKAMTQAYKYLWLDLLCVCDAGDDTDGNNYDGDRQPTRRPQSGSGGSRPSRSTQGSARTAESNTAPAATGERTYRSPQEASIRTSLNQMTPEARKLCTTAFKEKFETTLSDLPVARHQEAAEWLSDYLADPPAAASPPPPEAGA